MLADVFHRQSRYLVLLENDRHKQEIKSEITANDGLRGIRASEIDISTLPVTKPYCSCYLDKMIKKDDKWLIDSDDEFFNALSGNLKKVFDSFDDFDDME